jgi:serine protease Do
MFQHRAQDYMILKKYFTLPSALIQIIIASAFISSGAHASEVEPVPVIASSTPISIVDKNSAANVEIVPRTTLHVGDSVGSATFGIFCIKETKLVMKDLNANMTALSRAAYKTMKENGYKRFERNESAFDSQEAKSADFKLGATVKEFRDVTCRSGTDATGAVYYKVFWELFSSSRQKVVFSTTTEGSFQATSSVKISEMVENAGINATKNLLASKEFVAAFLADASPVMQVNQAVLEPITILNSIPLKGGVPKNIDVLRNAVVTVETAAGWGSGFYVDNEGYIITNHHVVQNEKFVRIRLANGTELVGEVLRKDAGRDVALIKTTPFDGTSLAVRMTPGLTAEDVYAIGSPRSKGLAGTVTKGILSADRVIDNQHFLQGDVAITFGNSGGPLIDAEGFVIGISTKVIPGTALNFFIPITDALKKLSMDVR